MMKLLKIKGKNKQKFKISSIDSNHNEPKVKDLVRRNFYQDDANRVWVFDVTVLETSKNNHVWIQLLFN